MTRKSLLTSMSVLCLFTLMAICPLMADAYERPQHKPAIVLAAFGTSDPEALQSILNVEKRVKQAFPGHDVYLSFTSNFLRAKWAKLSHDRDFRKANPNIPNRIYEIKNPFSVLAELQEKGYGDNTIVQSLHITNGLEYTDLKSIVDNLSKITASQKDLIPFPNLVLGDSALSKGSKADIDRAVSALSSLAVSAKEKNAALILMGHGNEQVPIPTYKKVEKALAERYQIPVFICLVEGDPGFDAALKFMKKGEYKSAYVAPMMLVAGDHAKNDMAGKEGDSLVSLLKASGADVTANIKGLGSLDQWADIYVEKIRELQQMQKQVKK